MNLTDDGRLPDMSHLPELEEPTPADGPAASRAPEARELVHESVAAWVEDLLIPLWRRPLNGDTKWCPRWWEHGEAVVRLEALWRAWEHLRYEGPTGVAVWFRDYCDPMMAVITGRNGPFQACKSDSRGGHVVPDAWPYEPASRDLWNDANRYRETS